jgi:hypothetical protein
VRPEDYRALPPAALRWSEAVWAAAEAGGPAALGRAEVRLGLEIARRPIFICGAHRSGTTLVRDLLDNHPALSVLPSEGTFFTSSRWYLARHAPGRRLGLLGREWLRRLANPIHQAPYWVLGRSAEDDSPYVHFARCLMAWWPIARRYVGVSASSWPLAAIALAYAQCTGGLNESSCVRNWVEKSPTNERYIARLQREYPRARVVHVVRHPLAVLASREEELRIADGGRLPARRIARSLERSYRIAARSGDGDDGHYLLMRYEDLLEKPRESVARLAAFLGIEPMPSLLEPSVAGRPAASNSSFRADAIPGHIEPGGASGVHSLNRQVRERLCVVLGDAAARLGYELEPIPVRRRVALRFATLLGLS